MPNNWKKYKFSDFVEINPTIRFSKDELYSFVEMKDLNEGQKYVLPSTEKAVTGGAKFEEFDTLFARITPCLQNGKICQVKGLKNNVGFGSTEFLVFRGIEGVSDSNFVYYLSCEKELRKFAEQNMIGTSGRQRVVKDAFQNLVLNLPPLPEQQAIAEILSALDDKIELNLQTNKTIEEIANVYLQKLMIDKGKSAIKLGDLISLQNGYAFKGSSFLSDGNQGVIKIKNINNGVVDIHTTDFVSASEVSALDLKFRLQSKNILIAMTGAEIGKVGIIEDTDKTIWLNQRVGLFVPRFYGSDKMAYLLVNSKVFQNFIKNKSTGSAQPNISGNEIESMTIECVEINHLKGSVDFIDPLFNKIARNLSESQTLKETRDYLLPKLIFGEIRVKEATKKLKELI